MLEKEKHLSLKRARHSILGNFFSGLNCGSSVGKPNNNGLLSKEEKHQRGDSKAKSNKDG